MTDKQDASGLGAMFDGLRSLSPRERFMSYVHPEPNSGCWLWVGANRGNGYGAFWHGFPQKAHHVAWEMFCDQPRGNLCVLHRCDVRCCVNPRHLFLGTHADNNKDRAAKGRSANTKGERHPGRKLDVDQVSAIRTDPRSQRKIAADFGISQVQVSSIKRGKSWAI